MGFGRSRLKEIQVLLLDLVAAVFCLWGNSLGKQRAS
jgi:hypothetical protein